MEYISVHQLDNNTLDEMLHERQGLFGYTPLHEAAVSGHHRVLDFLLSRGGDVNSRSASDYTPLLLAASNGNEKCVRVLLKHKADISLTDGYGKTPRQIAELSSKGRKIVHLLRSEGKKNERG